MSELPPESDVVLADSTAARFSRESVEALLDACSPSQTAILGMLAQSRAHRVDPAPWLNAIMAELSPKERSGVQDITEQWLNGTELVDAIESSQSLLPDSVMLAMRIAQESGTLDDLCEAIACRSIYVAPESDASQWSPVGNLFRLGAKAFTLLMIMTFIMLFVVPEHMKMYSEFELEWPFAFRMLLAHTDRFVKLWFIPAGIFMAALYWYIIPMLRNGRHRWSPSRWRQHARSTPVQNKLNLARLVESGLNFTDGLPVLSRYGGSKKSSAQIEKAKTLTINGGSQWAALAAAGVINNRQSEALEMASSDETRAWLLRRMADYEQQNRSRWLFAKAKLLTTAINVMLGIAVLLFVVGLFSPFVKLIRELSP